MGKFDKAETHWNRYFDHLEYNASRSHPADYLANLAFEGLNRLADLYTAKERWNSALGFLCRAHKFRPTDADVLERLFHLYDQLRRPEEARKILQRLREVRPNDAQVELFELNTREVRDINDLTLVMADLKRIDQKFPGNTQVGDRISATVHNLLPFMEKLFDQWNGQINKVLDQMRRLPSYQINWPMVREVMHELEDKFFQLRKSAGKAQALAQGSLRRDLTRLMSQCDRKMEQCHSLGE
jgi:tetratricopeptide (TPR) repeat protein